MLSSVTPPDLFLASPQSASLEARFTLHRGTPPATTRALVGGGSLQWSADGMARCPALEIIAVHGVGYDGIDVAAAAARGIRVTMTPDVLTADVADLAIGLWLAVERGIAANDRAVRDGVWQVPLARRASGRVVGIFGLGRIGRAIAERAAPFARSILYCARAAKPVSWTRMPDIGALARASDVLIIAAPGGNGTAKIVGRDVLRQLGREGVLINVARGALVDEDALAAALRDGTIAGAGLDVFVDEPSVPAVFKTKPQLVLSPHQGSATHEARAAMEALVLANLDAHFAGADLPTPLI